MQLVNKPITRRNLVRAVLEFTQFPLRFWQRVVKTPTCWFWAGKKKNGYGAISRTYSGKEKYLYAHQISFLLSGKALPMGQHVLHHCDIKACVRPDHLYAGTHQQNMRDAVLRGRMATGLRHGTRTHPESIQRGEKRWCAKLSDDDVYFIRKFYKHHDSKFGARALARRFGTKSGSYIVAVARHRSRQDLL